MKAIVTGATGFIGGRLVEALARSGSSVICVTRRPRAFRGRPGCTDVVADCRRTDLGLSDDVFDDVDVVFHLAGATRAPTEAEFFAVNEGLTGRLLERISASPRRPRVIFVSSQAAAGPARDADHPATELDEPAPLEAYGRSKLAAERVVLAREDSMRVTVVRPVAVYGPGDRDFLSIFRMAKRGLMIYPGIRDSIINTIHVDDLVASLIAIAESPATIGRTYFLGAPGASSWEGIYHQIAEVAGTRPREISIPLGAIVAAAKVGDLVGAITGTTPMLSSNKVALARPKFWLCSSARATEEFGFAAPTSLHDGLRHTYDWYRHHHWL